MKRILKPLAAFVLAACSNAATTPPTPALAPVASFQDLMVAVVDPSADGVWEAVGAETDASGHHEHAPRTDAEWAAVRQHAVRLVESAHLLLVPGRPIVAPGAKVEDAHIPGVNDAAAIQSAFAADPDAFTAAVQRLHGAATAALQAVDRRDTAAVLAAGQALEQACEACHRRYWYPNSPPPPAPALGPAIPVTATPKGSR